MACTKAKALDTFQSVGSPGRFRLPRPKLASGDLDFSFSGLKTAVLTASRQAPLDGTSRADLAAEFQAAVVEVLVTKSLAAAAQTSATRLVVAGGVGANVQLRDGLTKGAAARGIQVYYPDLAFCTDNGAMIAFAGAMRLGLAGPAGAFGVRPRWDLGSVQPAE